MSTSSYEVLMDTIKDKEEIIKVLNQRIITKDEMLTSLSQMVDSLSKKLVDRDNQIYDQIAKTYTTEDKYLQLVEKTELYQKEMRGLVRQLEYLHHDVVMGGIVEIGHGVSTLKSELEEEIK